MHTVNIWSALTYSALPITRAVNGNKQS